MSSRCHFASHREMSRAGGPPPWGLSRSATGPAEPAQRPLIGDCTERITWLSFWSPSVPATQPVNRGDRERYVVRGYYLLVIKTSATAAAATASRAIRRAV